LVVLRTLGLANFICGTVPPDDLLDMDLIILSHEYPRESSFLTAAAAAGVPIEYPESLFFKQAPPVTVVGIMGESGKSSVMSMLEPMLKAACAREEGQGFFALDPESNQGILAHMKRIRSGDVVLARIVPNIMRELSRMRMSPQVAVFTTVPGTDAYDEWPFEILAHQTYNNFMIASDEVIDAARAYKELPRAKMLRTKTTIIPTDWDFETVGVHDRENAAVALQAARLFKLDDETAQRILLRRKPLKNRLEFMRKVRHADFYNDAASTHPEATAAAIRSLSRGMDTVLIFGGMRSGDDYRVLYSAFPDHVHTIVLVPGSGTMIERATLAKIAAVNIVSAPSIEEAARLALEAAKKGDKVLFSPGFPAGGIDSSRRVRGERFERAVKSL
jgi:UDP-N-acetylmuramoylalanine-D-glutamate ligase